MLGALVVSGCAHMVKERGHEDVAARVQARTGFATRWEKGPPEAPEVQQWVSKLIDSGLTRERAIEIALLNNRALQATYEELGVSQADMVQAGLLKNPTLAASAGFPLTRSDHFELDFSIAQELLDLFILPLRRKIAEDQFQADTLRVTQEALDVVARVGKAFAAYQASVQQVDLRRQVLQSFELAADLAKRQLDAGNINEL